MWGLLPDAPATIIVRAEVDGGAVESEPVVIHTLPLPSEVPAVTVVAGAGAPPDGYLLTTLMAPSGASGARPAVAVFDMQGNYRWFRFLPVDTQQTRARIDPYTHEILTVFETLYRVGLDGALTGESGAGRPPAHHDFLPEPDRSAVTLQRVAYPLPEGGSAWVDRVVRINESVGSEEVIWDGSDHVVEQGWLQSHEQVPPALELIHANSLAWVALYLTCTPYMPGCQVGDYTPFGNDVGVLERFVEGSGTWLALLASPQQPAGLTHRRLLFLRPEADSTADAAPFLNEEGRFSVEADLSEVVGLRAPPGVAEVELDWSGLRHDGLGREVALYKLDTLEIGHVPNMALDALSARFVDIDTLATERWTLDVDQRSSALPSDARGTNGAFPGFDTDGTWIVSLRCGGCAAPIPTFFGWVDVQAD